MGAHCRHGARTCHSNRGGETTAGRLRSWPCDGTAVSRGFMGFLRSSFVVPFGIAALVAVWLQEGHAAEAPVEVGEVTTEPAGGGGVDTPALRAMVTQALRTIDGSRLPRGSRAVLSVALVRMDSRVESSAAVSCAVSATLRDRRGGTVFALLEGSASGEDQPPRLHALERATVRAAVGSAVARVPEAMLARRR